MNMYTHTQIHTNTDGIRIKNKKGKGSGREGRGWEHVTLASCISSFEASQYAGSENMEIPGAVEAGRNLCSSLIT